MENTNIPQSFMDVIQAKKYNSREELETYVINTYGKSTEPKDVVIQGKKDELKRLKLHHAASVWGVVAEATDYVEKPLAERPQRGKIYKSKLNGQNAQINKSSSRKRST